MLSPENLLKKKRELAAKATDPRDDMQDAEKIIFTCDDCGANDNCEYAFDLYNTDGDCLAEK